MADLLEPRDSEARFGDAVASGSDEATALAYDHEEDDEATISRPVDDLLAEAPPPSLQSRERPHTEPAKVAVSRTLAERLGRSVESPGAYSKQGPSLRKQEAKGKPPPPPPIGAAKAGGSEPAKATPAAARKADTEQSLPRSGLPAPSKAAGAKMPPVPGVVPRPSPGARPAAPPPTAAITPAPKPAPAPAPTPAPGPVATPIAAKPGPPKPRVMTEPQKVVFATPQPSEVAEIFAPPEGWPDLTDELAEVRLSALQGVDEGVLAELEALRLRHPTHPEVLELVAELDPAPEDSARLPIGVPTRTRPPIEPRPQPDLTPVEGPPPLGRYSTPQSGLLSVEPTASARFGAPRPAPAATSDELLDMDGNEFDDLDEPDPGDSMTDLTLVERLDLESLGVRDADELDDADASTADFDGDEPDFVDRTMMVPGLQPAAPYEASTSSEPPAAPPLRQRSPAERHSTLAPDSSRQRDDDERSATIPPGGFAVESDDPPTLSGRDEDEEAFVPMRRSSTLVPDLDGQPPIPAPYGGGMTTSESDAESASASGQFRVADLGLDDMPDLSQLPPLEEELEEELEVDLDASVTEEGTMVARSPVPPAPFGRDGAPVPVTAVRLVMLGPRGEPVAERRIEPGAFLDVGRQPGEPWGEDRRMESLHARLFPGAGGVVVDDFGLPSGVYTQIIDTIAVEDGDEFKVGQARLALQRVAGRGWAQLTILRHEETTPQTLLLDRDEIIIGREEGDITLPDDTFVSGDHCRFLREGHAIYLEDLGSSNGTYVRVRAGQCVAFGGLLLIGHTQFKVLPG